MRPEEAFTNQLLKIASKFGWRSLHIRPARTKDGWRTPVQGDGKGFPDLLLLRGNRMVVAELKCGKNKKTPEQQAWLQAFLLVTDEVYTWYPEDADEIMQVLRPS